MMFLKRFFLIAYVAILFSGTGQADEYSIERLEPPFWWQGFKNTELQLMVHGPAISDLTPAIKYPGISIARVERTNNPNYLFVYLDIAASARAGSFEIKFSNNTDMISHRYTLLDKNPDPAHAKRSEEHTSELQSR